MKRFKKSFFGTRLRARFENDRIHIRPTTAHIVKDMVNESVKNTWRNGRFFEAAYNRDPKINRNNAMAAPYGYRQK